MAELKTTTWKDIFGAMRELKVKSPTSPVVYERPSFLDKPTVPDDDDHPDSVFRMSSEAYEKHRADLEAALKESSFRISPSVSDSLIEEIAKYGIKPKDLIHDGSGSIMSPASLSRAVYEFPIKSASADAVDRIMSDIRRGSRVPEKDLRASMYDFLNDYQKIREIVAGAFSHYSADIAGITPIMDKFNSAGFDFNIITIPESGMYKLQSNSMQFTMLETLYDLLNSGDVGL